MRAIGGMVWSNKSVREFARDSDPISVMEEHARALTLKAMDAGWSGPPFDPIKLAEILRIPVQPSADVQDARTSPAGRKGLRIEYNPTRPRARVRFSIAHEIAHTFFPDCNENVRLRHQGRPNDGDEWQLEMLCNIGAAELIMPIGTLGGDTRVNLRIEDILELRKRYDVSVEAVLIRVAKLADFPCAAFCASKRDWNFNELGRYRIDYLISSRSWPYFLPSGTPLPGETVASECVAIGFTARGIEHWGESRPRVHVECVGLPGYPGSPVPRVAGVLRTPKRSGRAEGIKYVIGDALAPRGKSRKIIAHVVNDSTPNWGGGGFAVAVRRKWPHVQAAFQEWAVRNRDLFRLGRTYGIGAEDEISVLCMIAQRGFGPSEKPRIRYAALETCLETLATQATGTAASVHMPRIGTGHAGGSWQLIEELITNTLVARGVPVTIYDPPSKQSGKPTDLLLQGATVT